MTGHEWIAEFARRLGVEAPDVATFDSLLDVAAVAAHSSERIAAPIALYLLGQSGLGVDEAIELARHVTDSS